MYWPKYHIFPNKHTTCTAIQNSKSSFENVGRSRSAGFWWSQLIRIYTVFHPLDESISMMKSHPWTQLDLGSWYNTLVYELGVRLQENVHFLGQMLKSCSAWAEQCWLVCKLINSVFRILPSATRVTIGYRRLPMATFGNIWSLSAITSVSCWSPIPPRHDSRGSIGSWFMTSFQIGC